MTGTTEMVTGINTEIIGTTGGKMCTLGEATTPTGVGDIG